MDDLYICELCDKSFYDVDDYGHCGSCEVTLNESHENYFRHGYSDPSQCSMCFKPTLNKEKFGQLMYFMGKLAARDSFADFLEEIDISEDEYEDIKIYLEKTYGIKLYC